MVNVALLPEATVWAPAGEMVPLAPAVGVMM